MLMMDRYMEEVIVQAARAKSKGQHKATNEFIALYGVMQDTKRFVLDDNAVQIVQSVASGDRRKLRAETFFWPAGRTWMEMVHNGRRIGVMFIGHPEDGEQPQHSIRDGQLQIFFDTDPVFSKCRKGMGLCNLSTNMIWMRPMTSEVLEHVPNDLDPANDHIDGVKKIMGVIEKTKTTPEIDEAVDLTVAALALINSPRLLDIRDVRRDKLNAARHKRGKWPLLSHKEVKINLAKKELVSLVKDTDGSRRPLHFVRAHLRLWKGELLLVRPHWRGDPELGMVRPKYAVTHKD